MKHSIYIGDKNTYDDWHLLFPGHPIVNPPQPRLNYVDILGKSGRLDFTEALTKAPRYSDREGTWDFIILNPGDTLDFPLTAEYSKDLDDILSEIMTYCNGKRFDQIKLVDDPEYYYSGRIWVSNVQPSSGWTSITLSYHLDPFKYKEAEHTKVSITNANVYEHALGVPIGTMASPLRVIITPDDEYSNPVVELSLSNGEIITTHTYEKVTLKRSDYGWNEEVVLDVFPVSNMNGDNLCYLVVNTDLPITLEYWWVEARL